MIYWISYFLLTLFERFYFRTIFYGRENLPKIGNFILASNHISNLDPFVLGLVARKRFSFIAKEELFKAPLLNFYFHQVGAFPIKRESADFRAIREALRRLKRGNPLVIFPEGTRGVAGRVKKINSGIGLLAIKSNLPVLPVYIKGTDKCLPDKAKWFKRALVEVRIGKALYFSAQQSYHEVAIQIMDGIQSLIKSEK